MPLQPTPISPIASTNPNLLKPGTIGVMIKGAFDPLGTIDTVMQGDTVASHVWWVLPSGKIATTGAKFGVVYGEVEPEEYLKGRSFYLLNTLSPLSPTQLAGMEECHREIMASGINRVYGGWKFGVLETLHAIYGNVSKTGFKPKTEAPQYPICSQAVGYCCWKNGIPVGKAFGKEDYTAILPSTFLNEAMLVSALEKSYSYKFDNEFMKPGSGMFLEVTGVVLNYGSK